MIKINHITINHMLQPLGFNLDNHLHIEFSAENHASKSETKKRVVVITDQILYDSDWQDYQNNFFDFPIQLQPRTRYEVNISLKNATEDTSKSSFFETGKMDEPFDADWIGSNDKSIQNTLLKKDFELDRTVISARLYMTGLGVYEAYLNGQKIGQEFLAPGVTAYDRFTQVQTYDVTALLQESKGQELLITLGDGWYKGNFGFDGGEENTYGDQQMAIAELHLTYQDNFEQVISSDGSWLTTTGKITKSAIYYGEDYDDTRKISNWEPVAVIDHPKNMLRDRLSLPLEINEYLPVKEIIQTPAGETVLDFGQNHAGWPEFFNQESAGSTIKLEMGEILQDGNFYRDNLREARAAFKYISNGEKKWIRPHFTYFGYRYIKVSGNTKPLKADDFRSAVIYSAMKTTGGIQTNNAKVNRLFQNVLWGQKSNFFDIPTDCPQRDERLGWTGDADIFSGTAVLNMDTYAFFKKYANDMRIEQQQHDGMLTMYAPAMGNDNGGTAIWGDAATIIPWVSYRTYGDAAILRQNYASMKSWVDWVTKKTAKKNLWTGCFQFGDWLALDGEDRSFPTGRTDVDYIASIYYYYSSSIVSKSAEILGFEDDSKKYAQQAKAIKQAIRDEYITKNGRLAIDTQTAYALALNFKIVSEEERKRNVQALVSRLAKDDNHLKTGFVGTPLVCQALSDNGEHELATKIFLNEDFPSWLYAVNLGATTIWERWNSVLDDGSISPEDMNSLNHYSFGAIMQWGYQQVLGLKEQTNGYQKVVFAPQFDYRLHQVKGHYKSSYGDLKIEYQLESDENHTIEVKLNIPFGQELTVKLPRNDEQVEINDKIKKLPATLTNGEYLIRYQPKENYIEYYSIDMPIKKIMSNPELAEKLIGIKEDLVFFDDEVHLEIFGGDTILKLNKKLNLNFSKKDLSEIEKILNHTSIKK